MRMIWYGRAHCHLANVPILDLMRFGIATDRIDTERPHLQSTFLLCLDHDFEVRYRHCDHQECE